jgi:hypothetical protein
MDWKLIFGILSALVGFAGFIPYLRDIFAEETRPHLYTWLIWSITQGIATAAAWHGGGWGTYNLLIGTVLCAVVALLSLRYGTRDVTRSDTALLIGALAAVGIWWKLEDPLIALLTATAIDMAGYLPTFRKTWRDPGSETPSAWLGFIVAITFSILALETYTWLTATYLVAIGLANVLVLILTLRKPYGRSE